MWFVLNGTIGKVPTGQKATIPKGAASRFFLVDRLGCQSHAPVRLLKRTTLFDT